MLIKRLKSNLVKLILSLAIVSVLTSCANHETKSTSKTPETVKIDRKPTTLSAADEIDYQQAKDALDTKDYKRAKSLLQKLNKRHPSNESIQGNLAITYFNTKEFNFAKKHADIAKELNAKNPKILNLLGLIAVENHEFKDAESFYEDALKLDKAYAYAHFNLALLCDVYFQDVDRAYQHYTRYLALVDGADQEVKDWVEQLKYSLTQ